MADKNDPAKARDAALKDQRAAADAATQEHYDRVNSTQPTPTQEENDRAKLGLHSLEELDDKEADGSPEDRSALNYETRDAKAKK